MNIENILCKIILLCWYFLTSDASSFLLKLYLSKFTQRLPPGQIKNSYNFRETQVHRKGYSALGFHLCTHIDTALNLQPQKHLCYKHTCCWKHNPPVFSQHWEAPAQKFKHGFLLRMPSLSMYMCCLFFPTTLVKICLDSEIFSSLCPTVLYIYKTLIIIL